jgi:hypothetical protein
MQRKKYQRKKYFVDSAVQGAILRQAILFWLLGSLVFTLVVAVYRLLPAWISEGGLSFEQFWFHLSPLVISSATLLPLVFFQAIRFSHRFVGPMVRIRQTIKQLAKGQAIRSVKLRRGDYWKDIASDLNDLSVTIEALSEQSKRGESAHAFDEPFCREEALSSP